MNRTNPGVKASIEVSGEASVIAKLARANEEIEDALRKTSYEYALKMERTAKARAPVDEGRLRSSIRATLEGLTPTVKTDVEYAPFQEFGTGRRGAAAGIETPKGYDYGTVAGISPNSFLRPAFEEHIGDFKRALVIEVQKTMNRL